jgi:hypothetical protein
MADGDLFRKQVQWRCDELARHRRAQPLEHAGQAEAVDAQPAGHSSRFDGFMFRWIAPWLWA